MIKKLLTEEYLDKKFKDSGFVTETYLNKKLKDYVTKTYLDKRLYKLKDELRSETREDNKKLKEEFKDEVIAFKDEVIGEIKKLSENDAAHRYSHERIDEQLLALQEN